MIKQQRKDFKMNKTQAESLVEELTALLTDKELVAVSVYVDGVEVRTAQRFSAAYYVEHADGSCSVALADTYGVMTGAENWSIDPDLRSIHAETTNAYGRPVRFVWAIMDKSGEYWDMFWQAQKRLSQF